ncbi:unnamed protein product [Linum trigynum]|uniref:Uncharacterized protein n=1 Tax=Linum trigynum TaxID=586398 RepID=A0AAV2CY73_9ROSI
MEVHSSSPSGDEAINPHTRGHSFSNGAILYHHVSISNHVSPFFIHPSGNWGNVLFINPGMKEISPIGSAP